MTGVGGVIKAGGLGEAGLVVSIVSPSLSSFLRPEEAAFGGHDVHDCCYSTERSWALFFFFRVYQDRLWALPLFRAPASASFSTEPFRLVTAFLRQGDLLEGRDNICAQMQARSAGRADRQRQH